MIRKFWALLKNDKRLHLVLIVILAMTVFTVVRVTQVVGETSEQQTPQEQVAAVASGDLYEDREGLDANLPVTILPASDFLSRLSSEDNTIELAEVNPNAGVTAALVTPEGEAATIFASRLVESQQARAIAILNQKQVPISVTEPGVGLPANFPTAEPSSEVGMANFIFTFFFLLIVIIFALFMLAQFRQRSGGERLGKSSEGDAAPPDRFADVAGCDEAVEDLSELVLFLKEPERFTRAGAKAPRGALLVGPPGTGKTLLARAVAGEANVPFYAASGSDFMEMYVGVGSSRVRSLFKKARKHPEGAIIFIDEIDAIGRKRGAQTQAAGNQEQESTLNQLLVEMDGFHQSNVIVIGATNRDDILDPALKRPGRLDRTVMVGLPDRLGREQILKIHAQGRPLDDSVDLALMARRTSGMSGADLAQVVNEACIHAARDDRDVVLPNDFDSALATVAMGKARTSAVVSDNDRAITAWHEAGHTVAAMVVPDADPPVSVSIIPRGPAGGVTWMAPGDDLFLTRRRAFARLVVAMAGRAAEEILLDGEFTSGPHGDLNAASDLALAMVTQYGMTDMGLMTKSEGILSVGGKAMDESINAVEHLLSEALGVARQVLKDNRELLETVVNALLENDTLALADLEVIRESRNTITGTRAEDIPHSGFEPLREATERSALPRHTPPENVGASAGAIPSPVSALMSSLRRIMPRRKGRGAL